MREDTERTHWKMNETHSVRVNDFVLKVASVNGSGSASANSLLYKTLFRMGIPVSAKNIFPSNIQGLPTWYEIRANSAGHTARSPHVDVMVALNPTTLRDDMDEIASPGFFLYDSSWPLPKGFERDDVTMLPVPLNTLSIDAFPDPKIRILMKNITCVGALAAFLDLDLEIIKQVLRETYARKEHLIDANIQAIDLSYNHVTSTYDCPLPVRASSMNADTGKIMINGNTACALGALYAGATVAAWYPITPATSLTDAFRHLCEKYRRDADTGRYNACVVQAEDELAAAGIATGAGWAGVRAFTPTSGPGVSLMAETIGFAYHAEIPFVLFDVQRAGPSTGMPTRTQQGDIMTCVYASHGDTRHIVLFPADPEECFYLAVAAFDLAERFQTPVFVLTDLDIGMNDWIVPELTWDDEYRPDRGKVLGADELASLESFHRYLDSDGDGICYRTLPGVDPKGAYFTRGTSHNRYGRYSENGDDYIENVDRLHRKIRTARHAVPKPILEQGEPMSALGVVTVGSGDLATREALQRLRSDQINLDYMRIRAFPFDRTVESFLQTHAHILVVEQNRDGQLKSLLTLETYVEKEKLSSVLSYGGLPPDADTIDAGIRQILSRRDIHELHYKTGSSSSTVVGK